MDQAGRQIQAPAHAAGVRLHRPGASGGQVEPIQQLLGFALGVAPGQVVEPADHLDVLPAGQVLVHRGVLTGQPDVRPQLRRVPDDVIAGHLGASGVGPEQRGEDPDGGGLAGAIGPEDAQHGAGRHP